MTRLRVMLFVTAHFLFDVHIRPWAGGSEGPFGTIALGRLSRLVVTFTTPER